MLIWVQHGNAVIDTDPSAREGWVFDADKMVCSKIALKDFYEALKAASYDEVVKALTAKCATAGPEKLKDCLVKGFTH